MGCYKRLTLQDREDITLYLSHGMSYQTIAERLGRAVSTISRRKVSTIFQHIGIFFYVTTCGSSTLTGVVTTSKLFGFASSSLAVCPSSGLMATWLGGRGTCGGPLT